MKTARALPCLLILVALSGILSGCAPYKLAGTPITKAYVALDDYKTAQEVAISIGTDPQTPASAKEAIKKAVAFGNPSAHAVADLVKEYRASRDEVMAIDAAGGEPTPMAVQKAQIALARLKNALERLRPLVAQIEAAVNHSSN